MGRELLLLVALLFVSTGAKPFSKYGRSCKDINCLSNERCVMAEDPCSAYDSTQCGRYPTCKKADYAGNSCATMLCPSGQYCRTENGKPTCVNTVPNLEKDENQDKDISRPQNNAQNPTNPTGTQGGSLYPSLPNSGSSSGYPSYPSSGSSSGNPSGSGYPSYPSNSGSNSGSGYPSYPSNSGSNSGSGYPSYPSNSGSNSGYPAYPSSSGNTQNGYPAYPQNGRPTYPQNGGYPAYPQNGGYPTYPQHGYPNQPGNYPGYPAGNQGGYAGQGYYPVQPTTKKPSWTDKALNVAKGFAQRILTQAVIDKVTG